MAKNNPHNLTDKQLAFCNEYLKDFNATQAAIRAGYSENGANVQGSNLLSNINIQAWLSQRQSTIAKKVDLSLERVLAEYSKIGFFDIRKAFDEDGKMLPIHELDDDTAGGIAGIEIFEETEGSGEETFKSGETKKIKIADKRSALDSICKVLGYNAPEKQTIEMGISWNEEKTYVKPEND